MQKETKTASARRYPEEFRDASLRGYKFFPHAWVQEGGCGTKSKQHPPGGARKNLGTHHFAAINSSPMLGYRRADAELE